ncbi:MAG: GNAT family N-acetyltransferase [Clostridiales bacterium]|nr:GNAT family N-acetyltransferase [Clostridiales bacterium]MCD8110789.1 GNAT family N-acetyltransferase [Clostridiales bacterium]
MVFGKFVTEEKDMDTVRSIYEQVYQKELGLDILKTTEDEYCINALVFAGEDPAGMGRVLFDGEDFRIRDVAILPAYRGDSYGDFMVRLLVDKAMMSNAQEIRLDALAGTEEFFRTIGFETEGETFEDHGGRWQPMVLHAGSIHKCCDCQEQR